jgi:hypothetical protein
MLWMVASSRPRSSHSRRPSVHARRPDRPPPARCLSTLTGRLSTAAAEPSTGGRDRIEQACELLGARLGAKSARRIAGEPRSGRRAVSARGRRLARAGPRGPGRRAGQGAARARAPRGQRAGPPACSGAIPPRMAQATVTGPLATSVARIHPEPRSRRDIHGRPRAARAVLRHPGWHNGADGEQPGSGRRGDQGAAGVRAKSSNGDAAPRRGAQDHLHDPGSTSPRPRCRRPTGRT